MKYKKVNEMFNLEQHTTSIEKLIEMSIDNPQAFYRAIALNMTPQERQYIIELLVNKSCMTCINGSCRVEHSEKVGIDKNGKPQGYNCFGWENHEYVGRCKVLKRNDIHTLKSL